MNTQSLAELATCIKDLLKEQVRLDKFNTTSMDFDGVSIKRRHAAMESARECAIEIRRLRHEAHCLAVEAGIADMREANHYGESTAPAGFGRHVKFHRRIPSVDGGSASA